MKDVIGGLAWLMRSKKIDRIVSLDDFDVEKGAFLREHFRSPGMGQTTARHFRDKLAIRFKAADAGIPVPAFSALFNDDDIHQFTQKVEAPWIVKPRGQASATGMKKIYSAGELWEHLEKLGGDRHHYLVEQFKPGDVYHVDALSEGGKVIFARASQYLAPPFEVAHGGGIFRSVIVPFGSADSDDVAPTHDPMPLVLNPDTLETWLTVTAPGAEVLRLLRPAPRGALGKTRVSRRVGSVKNDDPECLLPGDGDDAPPRVERPRRRRAAAEPRSLSLFELEREGPAKARGH